MYTLEWLMKYANENQTEIKPGKWVPARPIRGPFIDRLKDAIRVMKGKADAFTWPEDETNA